MTNLEIDPDRRIVPVDPLCGASESNGSAGREKVWGISKCTTQLKIMHTSLYHLGSTKLFVNDGMSCTEKYTTTNTRHGPTAS